MKLYSLSNFAQATYGQGAYGGEGYQTSTTSSSSGSLTNTGMPVLLGGTVGVSLIVCAVILITKSRRKK